MKHQQSRGFGALAKRKQQMRTQALRLGFSIEESVGGKYQFTHTATGQKKVVVSMTSAEAFVEGLEFQSEIHSLEGNNG